MTFHEEKEPEAPSAERRVSYVASPHFGPLLRELKASLLVTTYQAGKMAVIGTKEEGTIDVSFHNFELAMGVAVRAQEIAVGTQQQIFFLQNSHDIAPRVPPVGQHDQCWLTRRSHFTGNIHGHEMAYCGDELWVVNTLFSCLCTLDDKYHFVPRWRPPFISPHYEPEDRCHLNGIALENSRPKFVTCMAEVDTAQGWRPIKTNAGCVIDVETGATVTRGLAMPHSPRVVQDRLLVLDSGCGTLVDVDRASGHREPITSFPGYARGFGILGPFAFIGLSKIRETAVFGGVPIAENRAALRCGVAIVDLRIGTTVATFEFKEGVEEIFAVEVLPDARCPAIRGPHLTEDGDTPIWVIPPPNMIPNRSSLASSSVHVSAPDWRTLMREGQALHDQGRPADATEKYRQAADIGTGSAELWNHFGNALQDIGQQERAMEAYRRAVAVDPDYVPAHQNLGYLLMNHGDPDEAVQHYAAAQRVAPNPMNRVLMATTLPVVYDSRTDLRQRRDRMAAEVRQLVSDDLCIDTTHVLVPTSFFVAYQGYNDRELMMDLGRVYRGPNLRENRLVRPQGKKIKIGFLSAYFRDHTIGRLNLGRIQRLSRDRFEVSVIATSPPRDEFANAFRQAANHYLVVPRHPSTARRMIAEMGLDVLVFADVGMDALASTLAHSRMAPVQCTTWGHPSTTGSQMIDYFVSSELAEIDGADSHYSEKLVRLPSLGIFYQRPPTNQSREARANFGFSPRQNIYLCPQTLFKFHPDFDDVLAGILRGDPAGELVLLEGRVLNWTQRLQARFARTMPDLTHRIRFLTAQPHAKFLDLMAASDVVLDPLHFGGGNTTLESLAIGTPVVTMPSAFLRGRLSTAMYKHLGHTELIASTPEDYIAKALKLTNDAEYRQSNRKAIAATSGQLFSDNAAIGDWEEFLEQCASR